VSQSQRGTMSSTLTFTINVLMHQERARSSLSVAYTAELHAAFVIVIWLIDIAGAVCRKHGQAGRTLSKGLSPVIPGITRAD
jgi:hypothetical protein